ncbi:MAG: site-2 protease family protein [Elusimicrobia bacterium]|nr:site-2 protease family protein [Elusimicrobiota bacterium]
MEWIVQLPLVSFSVIIRELSKGFAAFSKGDKTGERAGRLTLNPLAHLDPFGTVFLPLLCFVAGLPMLGWAKPMPVDEARLKGARQRVELAAAGPLAHLGLALGMAVLFKLAVVSRLFAPEFGKTVLEALLFGVSANLALALFDLLPLHPLDGGRAVAGLLSPAWRKRYERHAPYAGYLVLLFAASRWLDRLIVHPAGVAVAALGRAGLLR